MFHAYGHDKRNNSMDWVNEMYLFVNIYLYWLELPKINDTTHPSVINTWII